MKYNLILSGEDINLIEVAIRLRVEACEEDKNPGSIRWAKKWRELLVRFNKKIERQND